MANYTGTAGDDVYTGTGSSDTIAGLGGDDMLNGGAGNDSIDGGANNDTIDGGDGSDTLTGGAGNDTLNGGTESTTTAVDAASYTTAIGAVQVNLSLQGGAQNTGGAGIDTLIGIEQLIGSNFNDTLTSGDETSRLNGGAGDDMLIGGGGSDLLTGGAGNDTLDGGAFIDIAAYADATSGVTVNLNLQGVEQNTGGAGIDTLIGIENLQGSSFADVLTGDANNNSIVAGGGDDVINGGDGNDLIYAGAGNDAINGGAGVDMTSYAEATAGVNVDLGITTVQATALGNDTITGVENLIGSRFNDTLSGDANDNRLEGGAGSDTLNGHGGADVLIGGAGNDQFNGGDGVDTVSFATAGSAVQLAFDFDVGGGQLYSFSQSTTEGQDFYDSVENVIGSAFNDEMVGGDADNRLEGGAGDDKLGGRGGDDYIDGGEGHDIGYLAGNRADFQITVVDGVVTAVDLRPNGGGTDTLVNVEHLMFDDGTFDIEEFGPPEPRDDSLAITRGVQTVISVDALLANDRGFDAITGIANVVDATVQLIDGKLHILAAGPTASFDYTVGTGDDAQTAHVSIATLLATTGADVLNGGDADLAVLDGLNNHDTLTGTDGDDQLAGGAGNDILDGGAGDDRLVGGLGNDTFHIDSEGDIVVEAAGGGRDTVVSSLDSTTLADNVEVLILDGLALNGTGNALDNTIIGTDSSDTLDGGLGADRLEGGLGDDAYIVDNVGDKVIELAGGGIDGVHTSLSAYTLGANLESLFYTGEGDFTGTGNALANRLQGGAGNDRLDGGAGSGADELWGGQGDDTYVVRRATDRIYEFNGQGYDTVETAASFQLDSYGASIEQLIAIGTGNISLIGGFSTVRIIGNAGHNTLMSPALNAYLAGGAGNDIYYASTSATMVELANEGFDTVVTALDLTLAENLEKAIVSTAAAVYSTITLTGNGADNVLIGHGGANVLNGGAGADTMEGGLGDDTYHVDNTGDLVKEVGAGGDLVISAISYTLGNFVENLTLAGAVGLTGTGNAGANVITGSNGADTLNGLNGADTLLGGLANDILDGGLGNDILDGQAGADAMTGGAGNDAYYVDNAGDTVTENAGGGTDTVHVGDIAYTLGANVENAVSIAGVSATITGNAGANAITDTDNGSSSIFYGMDGNDVLTGVGGADILNGGLGNDRLIGLGGAHLMIGGAGNDTYVVVGDETITEQAGEGIDTILLDGSGPYVMADNVENLTWTGVGSGAEITGNDGDNVIRGYTNPNYAYTNVLDGAGGNDTLYGGEAGGSHLIGGEGNDKLYAGPSNYNILEGGDGDDTYYLSYLHGGMTITEAEDAGIDTLVVAKSIYTDYTLGAGIENVTYTGTHEVYEIKRFIGNELANTMRGGAANDSFRGEGGNDKLYGGDANDTLEGGEGDDRIEGGAGGDMMYGGEGDDLLTGGADGDYYNGGAGADRFIFLAATDSVAADRDIIEELDAQDVINLRAIDADTATAGDQAFAFIGTAGFSGVAGELRQYEIVNEYGYRETIVAGDIDGDGVADFEFAIWGSVTLNAGDFIL